MGKGGSDDIYLPMLYEYSEREWWICIASTYLFVTLQWLLALAVGIIVVSHSGIAQFVLNTAPGLAIYIISIILWIVVPILLLVFQACAGFQCFLYVIWYILLPIVVGLSCSYSGGIGQVVLETIILISVASIFITFYTWCIGPLGGYNFNLKTPAFMGMLLVFCLYFIIQVVHPFADLPISIFGCLVATGFSANLAVAATQILSQSDPLIAVIVHYTAFIKLLKDSFNN